MKVQNKVMLITYANALGDNLKDLKTVVDKHFDKAIKGIHILPFFPSSADRGFAPMTYKEVDSSFGNWDDIKALAKDRYLMYDFMANHISKSSEYFKDYQQKKDHSEYADLFIPYSKFWTNGEPTQQQVDMIYKRKPRAPYIDVEFADGSKDKIWCTFDEEQIDLNVKSKTTKKFFKDNLEFLSNHGASIIRLDAFAYVTKKENTNCFFVEPDVWESLEYIDKVLKGLDAALLPEIHEHYTMQLKIANQGYYVYDFALPMLLLHALYSGKKQKLVNWLKMCPRKQFTTLDTHDGIGVVDVIDLLNSDEIEFTKEKMYSHGASAKKIYSSEKYNNLDIYQINCTYYSALGDDDKAYLLSRAIQCFAPGIPQIYYVGLLAGKNDIELVEKTKTGRDINRHNYTMAEIDKEVHRPVIQNLIKLLEFRNEYPAFDGDIKIVETGNDYKLIISWINGKYIAELKADLKSKDFNIKYLYEEKMISLF